MSYSDKVSEWINAAPAKSARNDEERQDRNIDTITENNSKDNNRDSSENGNGTD